MMESGFEHRSGGLRPGAILGGGILLVVGTTLLLDRTGVIAASLGQLIAPLVLITMGAMIMVEKSGIVGGYRARPADGLGQPRRPGGSIPGLWQMGLGVWMLLSQTHVWGLDFQNSWPLIVILGGVIMLGKGIR